MKLGVSRTPKGAGLRLAGPAGESLLQVVAQGDALPGPVLFRGDLKALLELGVEFLDDIVVIARAKEDGGRLAALRDDEPRLLLGHLLEDRAELGAGDVGGNSRGHRRGSFGHFY